MAIFHCYVSSPEGIIRIPGNVDPGDVSNSSNSPCAPPPLAPPWHALRRLCPDPRWCAAARVPTGDGANRESSRNSWGILLMSPSKRMILPIFLGVWAAQKWISLAKKKAFHQPKCLVDQSKLTQHTTPIAKLPVHSFDANFWYWQVRVKKYNFFNTTKTSSWNTATTTKTWARHPKHHRTLSRHYTMARSPRKHANGVQIWRSLRFIPFEKYIVSVIWTPIPSHGFRKQSPHDRP